ncbi:hypothetical protein CL634_02075 [bacterium]|nr:hypothetical protein [bacterium]
MRKNEVARVRLLTRWSKAELDALSDDNFLFPEERSFPIVTAEDIAEALSNFRTIEYRMRREVFLDKLTRKARSLGPKFIKSLSKDVRDTLNIKSIAVSRNPQDYAYKNKQEALTKAEELGLTGFHTCQSSSDLYYIPGETRDSFLGWFREATDS